MTKKEIFQRRNEKWRIASQKIVDLRYMLEDILHSFNEEEKKSERYFQLVTNIRQQVNYALGEGLNHPHIRNEIANIANTINNEPNENKYANVVKPKESIKTIITKMKLKIQYLIVAILGAVIIKFFETLPIILQFLSSQKGRE